MQFGEKFLKRFLEENFSLDFAFAFTIYEWLSTQNRYQESIYQHYSKSVKEGHPI